MPPKEKTDAQIEKDIKRRALRAEFIRTPDEEKPAAILDVMRGIVYKKSADVVLGSCRESYAIKALSKKEKESGKEQEQRKPDLNNKAEFECAFDKWRSMLGFSASDYPIPEYDERKIRAEQDRKKKLAAKKASKE